MARLKEDEWSKFITKTQDKKKAEQDAAAKAIKELKISADKGGSPNTPTPDWDKNWPKPGTAPRPQDRPNIPTRLAHGSHEATDFGDGIPRYLDGHSPNDHKPPVDPSGNPIKDLTPTDPEVDRKNLASQLQIDGTLLASGDLVAGLFGRKEIDRGKIQGRTTHQNLLNIVASGGSMGALPDGWTQEQAQQYVNDFNSGLLRPRGK